MCHLSLMNSDICHYPLRSRYAKIMLVDKLSSLPAIRNWVAFVDDERSIGNGIVVTLAHNYTYVVDSGCATRGFDSLAEAMRGTDRSCVVCSDFPSVADTWAGYRMTLTDERQIRWACKEAVEVLWLKREGEIRRARIRAEMVLENLSAMDVSNSWREDARLGVIREYVTWMRDVVDMPVTSYDVDNTFGSLVARAMTNRPTLADAY